MPPALREEMQFSGAKKRFVQRNVKKSQIALERGNIHAPLGCIRALGMACLVHNQRARAKINKGIYKKLAYGHLHRKLSNTGGSHNPGRPCRIAHYAILYVTNPVFPIDIGRLDRVFLL